MTGRQFVATVPRSLEGVRVDRAVSMLTGVSRGEAAALVATGRVTVDGREVRTRSTPLMAGGVLEIELPGPPALAPEAEVPFRVVHEDPAFVVVDKPPGVVVHPGAGHRGGTLVAGLLARYPDIGRLSSICDPMRPGIVHRLDRGTSGLLVVARSVEAYRSLASQMAARSVGRKYVALVSGHLRDDRGLIDAPIGRSVRTPTKMAVSSGGRPARTGYEVLRRLELIVGGRATSAIPTTLVTCRLETGRTHQIRVHFAAIGHPVLGDERYGRTPRGVLVPGRLFLHAAELEIDHPVSGERMAWTAPLPADLVTVLGARGAGTGAPAPGAVVL